MDVTRSRLGFAGDWLIAAAFLIGTLLVAMLIIRELRGTSEARTAATSLTPTRAAVPPDAVAVPSLMLAEAHELRVGERAADAIARLEPKVTLLSRVTERGPLGTREIRSYQLSATRFIVVLEPFERSGEPRVAGIYLQ